MTSFHKHLFIYLSILAQAYSYVIDVNGELSLDMRISDVLVPFYERAMENYKDKKEKIKENHDYVTLTEENEEEEEYEEEEVNEEEKEKEVGSEKEKGSEKEEESEKEEKIEKVKKKEKDEKVEKQKVKNYEEEYDREENDKEVNDNNEDIGKTKKDTHKDTEEDDQEKLSGVTAAPVVECLYQYPDMVQFNAMLSNMMNELTKVFVGVHKRMRKKDARRYQETRFKVVEKKDTRFFERIYNNMTQEYSQFYNNTAGRVARAQEDPCENQEELKEVWRELLERSLSSLRRAAQKCIEEFLRSSRSDDKNTRKELEEYLTRELAKVRSTQLHMLCDSFQLCYNDLL